MDWEYTGEINLNVTFDKANGTDFGKVRNKYFVRFTIVSDTLV